MSSEHDNLGSESDDSDNGILATVSDTVFDLLRVPNKKSV